MRTGDWWMPATVQGQCSGCGAAYQSGGHPCVEAVLATGRSTAGGVQPSRVYPCDGCEHRAVCMEAERCWRSPLPLNAASSTREDPFPLKEIDYSRCRDHRGGRRLSGAARPYCSCSFRNLADVGCGPSLASRRLVDARGVVCSPARVGGLASRRHDVDWCRVAVLRRDAVPRLDVAVGRRRRVAVVVVTAGAAVPRVQGVGA